MNPPTNPRAAWWPYVAPMGAFLVLTSLEGYLPRSSAGPDPTWYPVAYAVKVAAVAAVAWACRSAWRDLRPWPGPAGVALAVGLGLAVAAVWVGLDPYYPKFAFLGTRQAFDPTAALSPPGAAAFLAVRLFGLALVVPLIEELFWRSFLMRWVINPEFERVPLGRVTPAAAAITSVLFAAEHPEWLPGLFTGLAWAGLLWRTRSVGACVLSHAVANLALGLYVIGSGDWKYL